MKWLWLLLSLNPTSFGISLTNARGSNGTWLESGTRCGASTLLAVQEDSQVTKRYATTSAEVENLEDIQEENGPLKVLFLSSDTGGGHRASAEALAKQFQLLYPGSTYELADIWTDHGCLPYRTLVNTYKHMSAHPRQWQLFFHLSNTRFNQVCADFHSKMTCERKIRDRIASHDPDVVVSVHPTMNYTPIISTRKISQEKGKHIPFFTVVTDLGSGHVMWFQKNVERLYLASEKLRNIARKRAKTPENKIVMTGLPIRHDFAVQAQALNNDRTSEIGKQYQYQVRQSLNIENPDKQVVLVMGGGEGVGSLSSIVDELYIEFTKQGVDATICVVCGRNEKLKSSLEKRNWDKIIAAAASEPSTTAGDNKKKKRKLLKRMFGGSKKNSQESNSSTTEQKGTVNVIGLGFVTNMAEYMVAADILVTKAGPGTIAEAAAVGLPCMLTSYLPGQEAGNVDVVVESGFGDYCEEPELIAQKVASWLKDEKLLNTMSHNAQKAGNPTAASEIVRDIGSITHHWMRLNQQ